ncbi:MAG TPA: hypothetical protein VL069_14265 [Opitutus sp.]|nr:hypothetical protein [Opitutus sp.]
MLRSLGLFMLLGGALLLAGCESSGSMTTRVRDRFHAPEPKVQVFEAEREEVFEAARAAMRRLDFQISKAGVAQGILNAHSRLHASDSFGKARQFVMEVRFHSYEPGKTEVAVVLREQEESASFAGATDLVLREHALYGSFFAALEEALQQKTANP